MPPAKRRSKRKFSLKDAPSKRLAQVAYAKGYIDALLGNGSVFVPGVGLVSGLVGSAGLVHVESKLQSGPAELLDTLHGPVACYVPGTESVHTKHGRMARFKKSFIGKSLNASKRV